MTATASRCDGGNTYEARLHSEEVSRGDDAAIGDSNLQQKEWRRAGDVVLQQRWVRRKKMRDARCVMRDAWCHGSKLWLRSGSGRAPCRIGRLGLAWREGTKATHLGKEPRALPIHHPIPIEHPIQPTQSTTHPTVERVGIPNNYPLTKSMTGLN